MFYGMFSFSPFVLVKMYPHLRCNSMSSKNPEASSQSLCSVDPSCYFGQHHIFWAVMTL